jgi:predicted nuclease of predicted toxin-antitoxin system
VRLLADVGIAQSTTTRLRELGHDVEHLRELGLQSLPDHAVLARAVQEGRVIITFDLDFGDLLAASGGSLPSVIMVRLPDQRPASATPRIVAGLEQFHKPLEEGALLVVEKARFRLRRLPLEQGDF